MAHSRRERHVKPSDYKFSLDMPYDESEFEENAMLLNQTHRSEVVRRDVVRSATCWDSVNSMLSFLSCGVWQAQKEEATIAMNRLN